MSKNKKNKKNNLDKNTITECMIIVHKKLNAHMYDTQMRNLLEEIINDMHKLRGDTLPMEPEHYIP